MQKNSKAFNRFKTFLVNKNMPFMEFNLFVDCGDFFIVDDLINKCLLVKVPGLKSLFLEVYNAEPSQIIQIANKFVRNTEHLLIPIERIKLN